MHETPLLSIVIPTFNAERHLAACLESLRPQVGSDVEVIVRDAGSTDNSVDIMEQYRDVISRLDSEPDHGQSDAIDQGFRIAKGRYVTWLNADDVLLPGTIDSIRTAIRQDPEVSWLAGDTALLDEAGLITSVSRGGTCIAGRRLRFAGVYGPSSVFLKSLYEEVGGLDLSFHYMMDTDLWYRFVEAGHRYRRVNHHWWGFRQHELSKTTAHMFLEARHDPYAPTEYRQNGERLEVQLRHKALGESALERLSLLYARAERLATLAAPLQVIDTFINRGKHWSAFERFPIG